MANRAKTVIGLQPAVSGISASSTSTGWPASATNDLAMVNGTTAGSFWLSTGPSYPEWVQFDFGSAVTLNTCLIGTGYGRTYSIKDGGIEYSTDGIAWSSPGGGSEFLALFGAGDPTVHQYAKVSFTSISARYWRVRIDAKYSGALVSTSEIIYYDSSLMGNELVAGSVITAPGFTTASVVALSDKQYQPGIYGVYCSATTNEIIGYSIDLGASQYIGGLDFLVLETTGYTPTVGELYTSADGVVWTKAEDVTMSAWSIECKIHTLLFSRIYYTRYFRFILKSAVNGFLNYEWWLYATLTPATPANPTSVTARASDTGTDIEVTWSEIAGDDNLLADIVYDITRQKDGGGYSSIATGVTSLYYVDTSLAAGSYDYKVQARNLYHARTSTAVQTSASVTSPAAAGGGAGRSMMCGAGGRVS